MAYRLNSLLRQKVYGFDFNTKQTMSKHYLEKGFVKFYTDTVRIQIRCYQFLFFLTLVKKK